MTDQTIATNDAFKDICLLLQIHKDTELIKTLFKSKGWEVSNSKLKGWRVRSGAYNKDFRAMPTQALKDFIVALKDEKLITVE